MIFSLFIHFKFDVGYICEGKVLQYYKLAQNNGRKVFKLFESIFEQHLVFALFILSFFYTIFCLLLIYLLICLFICLFVYLSGCLFVRLFSSRTFGCRDVYKVQIFSNNYFPFRNSKSPCYLLEENMKLNLFLQKQC